LERDKGRSHVRIIGKQLRHSVDTVFFTKDQWNFYGADAPLIGTGVLVPLAIGLAWALWRVREPRYFLLIVMLVAPIVTGGVLTVPDSGIPASSSRVLSIIPAVSALVGIGAERVSLLSSRRPAPQLVAALVVVLAVSIPSLNFYFRIYDSEGYSDVTTRQIDEFGRNVRSTVPAGTELHFLETDLWNMGHPALAFAVRDYPVIVIDAAGKPVRSYNPRHLQPVYGRVAVLFVGRRMLDVPLVMRNCPGGELKRFARLDVPTWPRAIYVVDATLITGPGIHPCLKP
jgi:hypothetical protein